MHAHLAAAAVCPRRDGTQHARAWRHVVVGEDVVELLAPAPAAEPADVRTLPVALLDDRFRLEARVVGRVVEIAGPLILGEPEVHQRAMPRLTNRHISYLLWPSAGDLL